ncbi:hypothetical protein [Paenibacillus anseongense]|uniref:hypothetical protein n=1 Tax=Paenibacillus anseongense TaxID=2682845 RepID=UPI002DB89EF5|nr:hypothetical protein [Paenibacillus anseongense]MEC0265158.1 hypothetical protein [Paenibacillus anseongense]
MNNLLDELLGEMEPKDRNNEMIHILQDFIIKSGNYHNFRAYMESQKEFMPLEVYGFLSAGVFSAWDSYMQELEFPTEPTEEDEVDDN